MTDAERDAVLREAQAACYRLFEHYWEKHSEFHRKKRHGEPLGQWENEESPVWYKAKQHAADECRRAIHELTSEYREWERRKLAEFAAAKEKA